MEKFEMDIDILASMTQADLEFAKWDFEMTFADDGLTEDELNLKWQTEYLPTLMATYDNVSSSLCYHSTGGLS
jgi:hypothetical protein